ncbi:4'-phosphopantetheinyl transferase superfamily protein [Ruminococcus sp.]|uniref:4'-phosphopantetheinyl transferase family protein n=1 Tax=Ruminococcus sp. TaxID=41978 RepID=UPI0025F6DB8F|nr:4'-phosphopantetheinyl transferase superfamily protein [Ruminococcus sp.]MCR4639212.1 4'-phosphopantetheinyl transferase superfamily protein [Ruminococcus sp.]
MKRTDIWLEVFLCDISDLLPEWINSNLLLIDNARLEKLKKLKREDDRNRCAVSGFLLYYVFSSFFQIQFEKSMIITALSGKPELNNGIMYFNLSHSGSKVAASFSNLPTGIDVEMKKPVKREVYRHCMTKQEEERLVSIDERQRDSEFIRLWTKKESFTKMTGMGLYDSFEGFSIKNCEKCLAEVWRGDKCKKIWIDSIEEENYWLSVCVDTDENLPGMNIHRISFSEIMERIEENVLRS